MKRLFLMLSLFLVMAVAATVEIIYSGKYLNEALEELQVLEVSMIQNEGNLNNADTLKLLDTVEEHWIEGENFILMINNHTIIRNACERVIALGECIRQNEYSDAMVNLRQSVHYVQDLQKDNKISLTNFF